MTKCAKTWLVLAAALILIGCMILGGVMNVLKWDLTKLSTSSYETNQYEINEIFNNISMNTDTAVIIFSLSDDENCRVECYEERNAKHSVSVEEDTLVIRVINEKSWYDHIGINFGTPKITVYLPKSEYTALSIQENTGDIEIPKDFKFEDVDISLSTGNVDCFASASGLTKIQTSTGTICVENTSAGALDLSASTGKVTVSNVTCEGNMIVRVSTGKTKLTNVACKNLTSTGSTGNIALHNVIAAETFSIKRSTGDIKFDSSDAAEIFAETDTGDVTGSLLTDKVFIAQTDTGKIDVPKTTIGGNCQIDTNTGDIKITIN